jgi:hypothetical protein
VRGLLGHTLLVSAVPGMAASNRAHPLVLLA